MIVGFYWSITSSYSIELDYLTLDCYKLMNDCPTIVDGKEFVYYRVEIIFILAPLDSCDQLVRFQFPEFIAESRLKHLCFRS